MEPGIGDCSAWLIAADDYVDLTADQIRKPMLGSGRARGTTFAAELGATTLLVASDGLTKYAAPSAICGVVRDTPNLQAAAERLVDCVRLRSGGLQDDVSVILVRREQ